MSFFQNSPKISIIITCYNSEKYIKFAIESIKKQNYKNWELIIINDFSNDSSKKILNKYKSKKIKIINLNKNIGPYKATDLALKKTKGKYIALLDSDDYSHKNRIAHQVSFLEKNEKIGLVVTRYKIIDENNKIIRNSNFFSSNEFNKRFPCENLCCNSSAMFRKKLLEKFKYYNKNYIYSCDYNFFLKIFKHSSIKYINKFYTFYRVHKASRTNTLKKRIIISENINHLKWSKENNLINKSNISLYYKRLFINYIKLFLIRFKI